MVNKNPGVEFERVVTDIQRQFDSKSNVTHNEILIDRLGQKRQFDVVLRGKFAGQDILGVIECKDLSRKVGTPRIDAFVTKSQDINANLKIIVSRNGFSKQAIEKARHYGIQTLSLLPEENSGPGFRVGTKWCVDIFRWAQISVELNLAVETEEPIHFNTEDLTIDNKKVLDWFTNYLIDNHSNETGEGWIVGIRIEFDKPQLIWLNHENSHLCNGITFRANRVREKKEKLVGWQGDGFFDWQKKQIRIPPDSRIKSHTVQADFINWDNRNEDEVYEKRLLKIQIIGILDQFRRVEDAIDLDSL